MPVALHCISATTQCPLYYRRCWCKFAACQDPLHNRKAPFEDFLATVLVCALDRECLRFLWWREGILTEA